MTDPDFADKTKRDFHLESGSPCIDVGAGTSILTDIEGNIRNNPDLGAFEYQE